MGGCAIAVKCAEARPPNRDKPPSTYHVDIVVHVPQAVADEAVQYLPMSVAHTCASRA